MPEQATIVWAIVLGAVGLFMLTGVVLYRRELRKALSGGSAWQWRLIAIVALCLVMGGGLLAWRGMHEQEDQPDDVAPPAPTEAELLAAASEHIIYVLDCSGSMVARFDRVRAEAVAHASGLSAESSFHVILFINGDIVEGPARGPGAATAKNKAALVKFMDTMRPLGQAGPADAIKRAFEQLAELKGAKKILLVTEARGLLEETAATVAAVAEGSKSGDVPIFVLVHGPITPEAKQLAEKIAQDTGGVFKHVAPDDE